jgi:hypothetical protein
VNCRHCQSNLDHLFLDLGNTPPSNAYLTEEDLSRPETSYPLRLFVCTECWLVQTEDFVATNELFRPDYAYFSSTSKTWLEHAALYCQMAKRRFSLDQDSLVIEIASNDGYLLKNFVASDIPCLGIEPTSDTADAAEQLGIPVMRSFFSATLGRKLADEGKKADLIIGNNIFAHVPDVNDFAKGLRVLIKPQGVITLEFPHLMRLVESRQFDTVYHEHFSYLSLQTVLNIFEKAGLRIFDVEELPTHGGSLRLYGCRKEAEYLETPAVASLLAEETRRGMNALNYYTNFQPQADAVKNDLLAFLQKQKKLGNTVAGYGAAAKGNTLLNYAGVKPELLPFVSDAAPSKQDRFLPGNHIPILPPDAIEKNHPEYVLILPWNLADEIQSQLAFIREWGGKFVTAIPSLEIK